MLMFLSGITKDLSKDEWIFSNFSLQAHPDTDTEGRTSDAAPSSMHIDDDIDHAMTKNGMKSNLKTGLNSEDIEVDEDIDGECSTAGNSRHGSIGEFADLRASSLSGKKKKKRGKKTSASAISTSNAKTPVTSNATSAIKSQNIHQPSTQSKQSSSHRKKKSVSWGRIELHYFPCDFGFSSVPLQDGFPLGMALTRVDTECVPLQQYEDQQRVYRQQQMVRAMTTGKKYHQDFIHLDTRKHLLKDILSGQSAMTAALNQELSVIQISRENKGCDCKHVKVDKLSVAKLKSELGLYCSQINISKESISSMTKADLSSHLREALKTCQLCKDNQCECYQAGVSCCSVGCECLRKAAKVGDCANPEGKSLFDPDAVSAFRKEKIRLFKLDAQN